MPWAWVTAGVSLIPLVLLGALAVRPDLWLVERVQFEGQDQATVAELRHLADIQNGTTVWDVDLERTRRGVQRHPWVREVTVTFAWPSTVNVGIEEHRPVALLAGDTMRYVCPEGHAFAPASTDDLDYPVISGVTAEVAARHPELPHRVVTEALALIRAISDTGVLPMERVGEVSFSATRGFTVHVTDGAQVIFALEDFEEQARRLSRLQQRGVSIDDPTYIDLGAPTVAIVRPLGDGPPPRPDLEALDAEG